MIIEEVANDIFTLLKQRIIEEYPEAQFSSKISRVRINFIIYCYKYHFLVRI